MLAVAEEEELQVPQELVELAEEEEGVAETPAPNGQGQEQVLPCPCSAGSTGQVREAGRAGQSACPCPDSPTGQGREAGRGRQGEQ